MLVTSLATLVLALFIAALFTGQGLIIWIAIAAIIFGLIIIFIVIIKIIILLNKVKQNGTQHGEKKLSQKRVELNECLDITDAMDIKDTLVQHGFLEKQYQELGQRLGLSHNDVTIIERDYRDDTSRQFEEVLRKWLCQGGSNCTWEAVIDALNKMNLHSIAIAIDKEKQPACKIYDHYNSKSIIKSKESLINTFIRLEMNVQDLKAMKDAIYNDYYNLLIFACILMECTQTSLIGQDILDDYYNEEKFCHGHGDFPVNNFEKKIRFLNKDIPKFEAIRVKRTELFLNVKEIMKDIDKERLKRYLCSYRSFFRSKISNGTSIEDIFDLIDDYCSLYNITLLEGVVEHFKNDEAKGHIKKYKEDLEDFSKNISASLICGELLSSPPSLRCKKLIFYVNRNVEDCMVNDIEELVVIACEKSEFGNRIKVVVIKEDNSFTIMCSFPLNLSESLITTSLQNLDLLKNKGIYKLTIGYYTLFTAEQEPSLTMSRGMLEQIFISKSVQLLNQEEELATLNEKVSEIGKEKEDTIKKLQEKNDLLQQQLSLFQSEKDEGYLSDDYRKMNAKLHHHISDLDYDIKQKKSRLEKVIQSERDKDKENKELKLQAEELRKELTERNKGIEKLQSTIKDKDNRIRVADEYSQQAISTSIRIPTLSNDWDGPHLHAVPIEIEMKSFDIHRKDNEYWYSPGFMSHVGGYKMCLGIQANGNENAKGKFMSLYVHLMVGQNDDRLEWPFRGIVKILLINRRHDSNHYIQDINFDFPQNESSQRPFNGVRIQSGIAAYTGQGGVEFIQQSKLLYNEIEKCEYLKDDTIRIRVTEVLVYSREIISVPSSLPPTQTDHKLLFEIKDFHRHKLSNSEQISKPFYSSPNGYKFALFVYPNGRGSKYTGKYVSVFVHLMKGEYDSQLSFPFRGTLIVQILNVRDKHKGHVERAVSFTESTDPSGKFGAQVAGFTTWFSSGRSFEGYGFHDMLHHDYLDYNASHNTEYLSYDNSLTLRITKIDVDSKRL